MFTEYTFRCMEFDQGVTARAFIKKNRENQEYSVGDEVLVLKDIGKLQECYKACEITHKRELPIPRNTVYFIVSKVPTEWADTVRIHKEELVRGLAHARVDGYID